MKNTKIGFVFTMLLLLSGINSYAQLKHPGGWLTQTDLSRIREKVATGQEPWRSAWNAVKNKRTSAAKVSSTITDRGALQKQGEAAFILAVKWIVTGDKRHATAGINILNAWARTVKRFKIDDTSLRIGIGSNMMANAAEIFAHGFNGAAGWRQQDVRAAQNWFKNVVYPLTSTGRKRSMNWGTACVAGNMSMAVFVNDRTMFNDAIEAFKNGFRNTNDGCAGVTQYIVNEEGQCFESERDQGHTQGGIAHLVEPAMIAWNQGIDLVSYKKNRLVAGMEYTAKYNLGNRVPFQNNVINPCNIRFDWMNNGFISAQDRGDFSPVYVMATTLFDYANKNNRYTKEVASLSKYFPEKGNSDHPGMGHLLYSGAKGSTSDSKIVHIRKSNASNFAMDGGKGGANGQNIYLWSSNASNNNQQWNEINRGNGFYSYQKRGTNFCIDGGNGGTNRQNVYLWTCNDRNQNQQWKKVSTGSGNFKLIKRNAPYAIDGGNRGANRQNIALYAASNRSQNLQWRITPVNNVKKTISLDNRTQKIEGLEFYPNPVKEVLNIEFKGEEATFSLINLIGQKVHSGIIKKGNNTIALDNLDKGVYIIKINQGGETLVKKIIND